MAEALAICIVVCSGSKTSHQSLLTDEAKSTNPDFVGLRKEQYQGGETFRLVGGQEKVKAAKIKKVLFPTCVPNPGKFGRNHCIVARGLERYNSNLTLIRSINTTNLRLSMKLGGPVF